MKLIIKSPKPRNPLVAPSLARKAGAHRTGRGSRRRLGEDALRRELVRLVDPSP
ncbi:MAG: hypothetical protein HZC37_15050 [Burkholderiales bacterium]|nr:hypothetical protein [Burkholderiales bacterium]